MKTDNTLLLSLQQLERLHACFANALSPYGKINLVTAFESECKTACDNIARLLYEKDPSPLHEYVQELDVDEWMRKIVYWKDDLRETVNFSLKNFFNWNLSYSLGIAFLRLTQLMIRLKVAMDHSSPAIGSDTSLPDADDNFSLSPIFASQFRTNTQAAHMLKDKLLALAPTIGNKKIVPNRSWGHVQEALTRLDYIDSQCYSADFARYIAEICGLKSENVAQALKRYRNEHVPTYVDDNVIVELMTALKVTD